MRYRELPRDADALQEPVADDVLAALCRKLLGAQAELLAAERLQGGRFNTCYGLQCAGHAPLILRLAPPPAAHLFRHERAPLQRECSIQPLLADAAAVFPRLIATDFSGTIVPRACVLQNRLEGELWSNVATRLDAADTASLWRQLGFYVRRIHGITASAYGFPAPAAEHARYSDFLRSWVDGMAQDLDELGLVVDGIEQFRQLLRRGADRIDEARTPCLVHGDLWPRNILVAQRAGAWVITGILDAERAFWGDPAAEWIFSFLDIPEDFWRAYGRDYSIGMLDGAAMFRRRCYQARGSLQLILEGRRHGFDTAFAHRDFAGSLARMDDSITCKLAACADAA
ncbi:MAG: phosphotransferase [Rhodocyclales bacterium]|nr:phosphotransferase [Rhodocyclales bacterium]